MTDELLTPNEVARYLRVHVETVYKWLASGRLPGLKTGAGRNARWRVRASELDAALERGLH